MADIVVDSSIIIGIARLYKNNERKPRTRREFYLFQIMEQLEEGNINCVVTPTILKEIKRGAKYDNGFGEKIVSRYGIRYDFDDQDKSKTLELVEAYGNYLINNEPAIELAQNKTSRNYFDARIVAETSVLQKKLGRQIPILTDNIRDICDESKINIINTNYNLLKTHIHSMHTLQEAIAFSESNSEKE